MGTIPSPESLKLKDFHNSSSSKKGTELIYTHYFPILIQTASTLSCTLLLTECTLETIPLLYIKTFLIVRFLVCAQLLSHAQLFETP